MLDVIIVNYNTKDLLEENLSAIFNSNYKNFNVYVIDNASVDDSVKMIKKSLYS